MWPYVFYLTCTKCIIKPHSYLRNKALRQVLRKCLQIVSYVNFCSHVRIFVRKGLRGVMSPNKKHSRHKIIVFKMASINKHLFAVLLVILKKRRRRENRKHEKKKIRVKKMNKNRLELVLFQLCHLL